MQQYAIHKLKTSNLPVIILQYPGLETSGLIIVAPVIAADSLPEIEPIAPIISAGGENWMMLTYRLSAVPEDEIGDKIMQADTDDYVFHRAISRIFFGN